MLRRMMALLCAFLAIPAAAQEQAAPEEMLELAPHTLRTLEPTPPPSPERLRQIRGWIRQFAEIENAGPGYSPAQASTIFAPHPDSYEVGSMLIGEGPYPQLEECIRKVVEAGSDAIPLLLHHLNDPTQTRFDPYLRGAFLSNDTEMAYNPAAGEKSLPRKRSWLAERSEYQLVQDAEPAGVGYHVKVGDICFAVLGQITGRGFQAMRYQPSRVIVVNSPVESPELCAAVRGNWASASTREGFFQRLQHDFATRARATGSELEGSAQEIAFGLEMEAARRLLYYFPQESDTLVAERLREWLRMPAEKRPARAEAALRAVAQRPPPATEAVLIDLARVTTSPEVWLAVGRLAGAKDAPFALARTQSFLRALPREKGGAALLAMIMRFAPSDRGRQLAQSQLQRTSVARAAGVVEALLRERPSWAVEVLGGLLGDRRALENGYGLLLCDAAADAAAQLDPTLPFERKRDPAERAAQVAGLQRALELRRR